MFAFLIVTLILYVIYRRVARGGFNPQTPRLAADTALVPVVDRIRAEDLGFELEVFLQRAEMIFFLVHGHVFDDLTVRITASAADFEIDQNNRIVFGDRTVRPFTEDWTFRRSVGVATTLKPGTLENTCPNCGAPDAGTQIALQVGGAIVGGLLSSLLSDDFSKRDWS